MEVNCSFIHIQSFVGIVWYRYMNKHWLLGECRSQVIVRITMLSYRLSGSRPIGCLEGTFSQNRQQSQKDEVRDSVKRTKQDKPMGFFLLTQ